jgi:hypothetical protein
MALKPIEISKVAHDAALHFLARPKAHVLTEAIRDLDFVAAGMPIGADAFDLAENQIRTGHERLANAAVVCRS